MTALRILSACLVAALASCSGGDNTSSRPTLTVSIEPQRKILEEIAGPDYEVVSILGAGSNPETYEPTMSQLASAARSQAYFTIGYLPFEDKISASLPSSTKIEPSGYGIQPLTGTHSHGDGEQDRTPDPHIWTSLPNAAIIAKNMANTLTEINPDHAADYAARLAAFTGRIDSLHAATAARLASAPSRAFAVWHPSLSYYARDYGLRQIAVGTEGKEMSPGAMRDAIDHTRADSVRIFFFQKEYDSRQAQSLNSEIGSRLIEINPMAYDWEAEIIKITDALTSE